MFEKIAESLLGDWGRSALNFVYEYQLIISIIVVAWGIVLIIRKGKSRSEKNDNDDNKEYKE
ncbi:MAG: hypothetical protein PQJ61_10975 [Spirochaetales bacterium]|uniref:Uncharacterized protein n=1 Tax=Candidatus Thalassospirochaeta sargassi TaxID=3119039 RepID=A0AAJ1IDF1_9SPIO|nr:hypothetical protein [Spirochaetales bacterium]